MLDNKRFFPALTVFLLFFGMVVSGCYRGPSVDDLKRLQAEADEDFVAGRFAKAAPVYEMIAINTRAALGPRSAQYAATLVTLGNCWLAMTRIYSADSAFSTAEAILNRFPNLDSLRYNCLLGHGLTKLGQKEYGQAIVILKDALEVSEKLFGPTSQHLDDVLASLDVCYSNQRDYVNEVPFVEQQLAVRLMNPDFDASKLMNLIDRLWRLYLHIPAIERGNQFFLKAISSVDSGATHDRRPLPYLQIGYGVFSCYQQTGRERCDAMVKAAFASADEVFKNDKEGLAEFHTQYASVLRKNGYNRGADAMEIKASAIRQGLAP
jgi:tetratricopeptide (TPR) repeat protein